MDFSQIALPGRGQDLRNKHLQEVKGKHGKMQTLTNSSIHGKNKLRNCSGFKPRCLPLVE